MSKDKSSHKLSQYSRYIHLSRYARWDDTKKRRETWEETVDRYINFFSNKFEHFPSEEIKKAITNLEVMPSMRCLMTAGAALERDQIAAYNCLAGDTLVTTREYGVTPIKNLKGKTASIIDGNGNWTLAPCYSYGEQKLLTIHFVSTKNEQFSIKATPNHRWILKDGTEKTTNQLKSDDQLALVEMPKRSFVDKNSSEYLKGIQHGIVYGDDSENNKNLIIKLFGKKTQLSTYFNSLSLSGDECFFSVPGDANLKELPTFENESNDYLVGFIRGLIAISGTHDCLYVTKEGGEWILEHGPKLGFFIQNFSFEAKYKRGVIYFDKKWMTESDFLIKDYQKDFILAAHECFEFGKIDRIEDKEEVEEVFCFEVPTTQSFHLTKNLLSGNCSYLSIDHPRAFDEILYILMCFSPDTEVKTKSGNKKISELTTADEVLSYNENKKVFEYLAPSQVVKTPSRAKEKIELTLEDGSTIKCTSDHRFLTENRGWVEAKDLTEEDEIKNFYEQSN